MIFECGFNELIQSCMKSYLPFFNDIYHKNVLLYIFDDYCRNNIMCVDAYTCLRVHGMCLGVHLYMSACIGVYKHVYMFISAYPYI